MRICLVYDCLFPHTVGGAERWLRSVAERLAREGHEVTYLTLRQWDEGVDPGVPGVRVVEAGPRMALYTEGGRRRMLPPLVFGLGVLWHLLRRGGDYDVVHTASFPFFSLLAAAAVRPLRRFGLVVDWYEVWTRAYWEEYLGALGGRVGHLVQKLCVLAPQRAFCFSSLAERRLREEGLRGDVTVLRGMFEAPDAREPSPAASPPHVVYAGRHIPEKRVPALVGALVEARKELPELRATIFGDGPDRPEVLRLIEEHDAGSWLRAPGFVSSEEVQSAIRSALCLVLPSRREGYGMVIVEASAAAVPAVVVADDDNAAVELVDEGVNGTIAASASAADLADAIVRVAAAGP
ncbi:MAG TPA: glycosyltransferase, partial [Solirubrobacteraceae bacterium]|nr:glycosyltransferase [Solirubrobacteraceae bacterium]